MQGLNEYAAWAGFEPGVVTPTALRYTAAKRGLAAGDSLEDLMAFLGLSSLDATKAFVRGIRWDEEGEGVGFTPGQRGPIQRRKVGAQPRNQNNLWHGMYAKYFVPDPEELREAMMAEGLDEEMLMMRLMMLWVFELCEHVEDAEIAFKMVDVLGVASMRLARMMKIKHEIEGDAVKGVDFETDDLDL